MTSRRPSARERAAADAERGDLWRARERLASYLVSTGYEPSALAELGRICLRMGDPLEAGRFLLTSNAEGPEVEHAVALFAQRHGGNGRQLRAQLPRFARPPLAAFPPEARTRLERLGMATVEYFPGPSARPPIARATRPAVAVGCLLLLLSVGVLLVAGAVTIVRWVAG